MSAAAPEPGAPAMPGWMDRVAASVARVTPGDLSRFTPPAGRDVRRAAVLMLFGDADATDPDTTDPDSTDPDAAPAGRVLLIERAAGLRSHPGQVAFPGGAMDPSDGSPEAAALREAAEETGLEPDGVDVVGRLPELYLPPSGFAVTPVVAWWRRPVPVRVGDPAEVARVVPVGLAELLDPANRFTVLHPSGYSGPGFRAGGLFVWGFTAGLLSRLLAHAGLERPWDARRREPLPAAQLRPPVATDDEQVLP